eukprot:TRINITY_DN234_c0_g1_i2.p1 TRINITY_DN234_c0_g1~~TRINITY_DN234_c0_g1_i2.p1  ORF type:complete len:163 (+),score=38.03 TRINITY_DN234_c0_g1_i2:33-491(+)
MGAQPVPAGNVVMKGWGSDECACFNDTETCLCAMCCGLQLTAFTYNRAGFGGYLVLTLMFFLWLTAVCLGTYFSGFVILLCLVNLAWRIYYRGLLREKYRIMGSPCMDCVVHCFIPCCATAQEARQMIIYEHPDLVHFDKSVCPALDPASDF